MEKVQAKSQHAPKLVTDASDPWGLRHWTPKDDAEQTKWMQIIVGGTMILIVSVGAVALLLATYLSW